RRIYEELGMELHANGTLFVLTWIEHAAGDFEAAARAIHECCDYLETIGERGYLSLNFGYLADMLYALGRYDDAEAAVQESERLTQAGDATSEVIWRSVRAKLLARQGATDEALRLAREAIVWIDTTDSVISTGDAYSGYAEVLHAAGRD